MKFGITRVKYLKFNKLLIVFIAFNFSFYDFVKCQDENPNNLSLKNESSFCNERFSISMGTFISNSNSGISLGSKQLGIGIVLDLEDALGLKTSTSVFRGNIIYRFGKRKQYAFVFDYFSINRKASKTLEAELEIGDQTYPIGTQIKTKFNLSIIRAKYDYSFLRDDRVSLGLTAGFFIIPIDFDISSSSFESPNAHIIAPLPVFGLRSDFLITKRIYIKQSAELLYLKVNNFSGGIVDLNFALEHRFSKHFGYGLGINAYRLNIYAKGDDYPAISFFGNIKMDYTGIILYLNYTF